jgi:protocatechuate 3,4-dioxygenase beta subunit
MPCKKCTTTILGLLIASIIFINNTAASEKNGTHLKFSLEAQPVTVTVSGKVTDKDTGEPIANAFVRGHVVIWKYRGPDLFEKCPYQETTTDTEGNYQLQFITPLTTSGPSKGEDGLCVYVSAAGYETKPKYGRPRVTPDNTDYLDFNFELGPGKLIKGTVVDEQSNPVEGARVRVQNGSNGDWNFFGSLGETSTEKDGSFEVWFGSDNQYQTRNPWLCILKEGQGAGFYWDILKKEDMGTLILSSGGSIAGRLIDTKGNGIENCEISVRGFPCDVIIKTLTDNDGNYLLRGIPGDPSIVEFYKKKNKRYMDIWGKVKVYADVNPMMNLRDVPQYEIMAQDGKTITGPDLVVGATSSVSGKLAISQNTFGPGGLIVRLDYSWDNMVEVDADGNFYFPFVSPGKYRLTAYLPYNLRYDRGIGQTEIEVKEGEPVKDIQIQLEDLAELRLQYLDADGNPLEGITAGATWSKSGDGSWTEGTKSDKDGWAVLYLYADSTQYVRGFDFAGDLVAEGFEMVEPQAGQIMDNLQIVMVPSGSVSGQLLNDNNELLSETVILYKLDFADGVQQQRRVKTDSSGEFAIDRLPPGIVKLSMEIDSVVFDDVVGGSFELKPGERKDLGEIILKNGLDKPKTISEKHASAMENPEEIVEAAEQLFEKIRNADYEHFLKKGVHWSSFPIVGYYQTHHWFDVLVKWICTTFKDNPIIQVELGEVFKSPEAINQKIELPTIPYKLTLKDGTVLQGNLPFEYNFDGGKGHWHGIHRIDWHIKEE